TVKLNGGEKMRSWVLWEEDDNGNPIPVDVKFDWEFEDSKRSEQKQPESAQKGRPDSLVLLTAEQAAKLLGISRATFWKLYSAGRIPRAIRLSARVVRWLREDLKTWVRNRCRKIEEV